MLRKIGGYTATLAVCILPASAQVSWGLRAGLSHASLIYKTDKEYRSGARLGCDVAALADIPCYKRFSLAPEISFTYQGGSFLSGLDEEDESSPLWKHSVESYCLQPSLNVAFNIPISDVSMAVFIGPAANFRLAEQIKNRATGDNPDPETSGVKLRSVDYGVHSGVSVEYLNIFFSMTFFCGTFDLQSEKEEGESPLYQNNITLSLGYFFRR